MDHFLSSHCLFLEFTASNPPLINFLNFGVYQGSKVKIITVEVCLLLKLESKFILPLLKVLDIIIPVVQQFRESNQLVGEQGQFVFMLVDDVFIIPEFHYINLILLALLLVVLDFRVSVTHHLSALSDLVLKSTSLVLVADGHLSDFAVNHGLALAIHEIPELLQLLSLAPLRSLVSSLPLLNFLQQLLVLVFLGLVLLLQREVDLSELVLQLLVFVVDILANGIELLMLLTA